MNKTFNTLLVALITSILFTGIIVAETPTAAADSKQNVETSTQLTVNPNPVGVGQRIQINVSISPAPPTTEDYFTGILVKIIRPDGTDETIGPLATFPDWPNKTNYAISIDFVVDQAGLFNITTNYLGDTYSNGQIVYLLSTSNTVALRATRELQPQPTPTPTQTPMPTPTTSLPSTPTPTSQNKKTATLSIDAENTDKIANSTLTVKGRLWAPETIGIAVQNVIVSYQLPGESTWTLIGSPMTNEWGKYDFRWTQPSGTFVLKAEWAGNNEYYPISNITTVGKLPIEKQQAIIQSNSTITQITYKETVGISFTLSGETGTQGYAKVVLPKSLMPQSQNIKVYIDEKTANFDLTTQGDSWVIGFTYSHSTHQVVVTTNAENQQGNTLGIDNMMWITAGIIAVALAVVAGVIVWLAKNREK